MKPTRITSSLTAAMVLSLAQMSNADDGTYTSQTGAWNLAGSWSDGIIADGTDSTAFFTNDITAARTTSLGADRTIGHIVFTDAVSSHNRTIANNILTFDVTSGRSTIDVTQDNRLLFFGSQLSGDDGLRLIGPGQVRFDNTNNNYSGGTEINAGTLWLFASGTAGSGTILLGNTTGSDNAELRMSSNANISNALEVRAGSSGTKTLSNRNPQSVTYSGNITANDNLTVLYAGTTGTGSFIINGADNSIAVGKTVSFDISSAAGASGGIIDSALWSGDGSISYTSSNSAKGFTVSGAKTYSGGATLDSMSGTGVLVVQTSSIGPANTPTSGAFGTGMLTLGATKMQAHTTADITIGNAITFSDNPTFTTVANEKSLIFTGDASLGATRTLTVETGSKVADTFVEFSGEISGDTFGISKEGAGTLLLSGTSTYNGATTVSAGTLYVTGSLANSAVTIEDNAALGGAGVVASVTFEGGSRFDIFEAIANTAALTSNAISFSTTGFGIDNLVFNGSAVDWSTITNGTYTLITGTLDETNLNDLGSVNPFDIGGGRSAYFENDSLQLVVIPEPSTALLGSLGLLFSLRRRR